MVAPPPPGGVIPSGRGRARQDVHPEGMRVLSCDRGGSAHGLPSHAAPAPGVAGATYDQPADVFVVFGITGDLAKVMTLHSLYRLEARGLLDCPIVGVAVDDWTVDDLRERAREAIVASGETLDPAVFERFAARLSYMAGDFGDPETFERLAGRLKDARSPVFYLEIPPFLFGAVVKGLAGAGLTANARVVVEKPFGHDLESARALAAEMHEYLDERQLYRIDHYLGKLGVTEILLPALRQRDPRAGLAPQLRRERADHDGRAASASTTAATSTTRSARCATSSSTT